LIFCELIGENNEIFISDNKSNIVENFVVIFLFIF